MLITTDIKEQALEIVSEIAESIKYPETDDIGHINSVLNAQIKRLLDTLKG